MPITDTTTTAETATVATISYAEIEREARALLALPEPPGWVCGSFLRCIVADIIRRRTDAAQASVDCYKDSFGQWYLSAWYTFNSNAPSFGVKAATPEDANWIALLIRRFDALEQQAAVRFNSNYYTPSTTELLTLLDSIAHERALEVRPWE